MGILPTHHTVNVAGIRNMTYDERLAENTARLVGPLL